MITDLVAIGDLHLTDSSGKGGLSSYIKNHDAMVADLVIDQPLKWARKNGVRHIVLLGDICENPRLSYEGQLNLLRILRAPFEGKEHFEFHLFLGNHDCFATDPSAGHSLQIIKEFGLPNVHIYERPRTLKNNGHPIRFLPWPSTDFDLRALNFAHVDVEGSRTDSGRVNKSDKLSRSKALAVIGHIHTEQRVRNSYYPGCLYQTNFGEKGDKFFASISWDNEWVVENIPVRPTYRLHTVEVESKRDLKGVPSSEFDLIKLIIKDKAKVTADDYGSLNVVKVVTANTASELALARVADLEEGSAVEISSTEFFKAWLKTRPVELELKKEAFSLRRSILKGAAK